MITKVYKYLILGTKEDLDLFYHRAQVGGFIEFISSGKSMKEVPLIVHTLSQALKITNKLPAVEYTGGELEDEKIIEGAEALIALRQEEEKLLEQKRVLDVEIARVLPFGDFSMEEIHSLEKEGNCKIQFFCGKVGRFPETPFIHIATYYDLDYFLSVSPHAVTANGMIEMRIEHSVTELLEKKKQLLKLITEIDGKIKHFSSYRKFIKELLESNLDNYHLRLAKEDVTLPLEGTSLFSVEAWIPKTKISKMFSLLSGLSVHSEQIQIEKEDRIPTVMENKGIARLGEDLVKVYDAPSSSDKDPSGFVIWSFALFFAMILADGGYGLLFLAIAAYLKWKIPNMKGAGKRFFKLGVMLSVATFAWGIVTSAFFGLEIAPTSFLGKISPLQMLVQAKAAYHMNMGDDVYRQWLEYLPALSEAKNAEEFIALGVRKTALGVKHIVYEAFADNLLLEFSLVAGVIHLSISLLRYARRSLSNIGWAVFLVGGYLFFPSMLDATSLVNFLGWISKPTATDIGRELLYTGLGSAFFLAFCQKKWGAFSELTRIVEVFGDTLSYLRLYALALASTILAETFNEMGSAIGLVAGFFVIILGHGINISLGLMAGTIHGLRLNFIEWYHFSFEGGGKLFNPLQLLKSKEED